MIKCPKCKSKNIIWEVAVRIPFKRGDDGQIAIIPDYSDIIEDIKRNGTFDNAVLTCEDCGYSKGVDFYD